MPFHRLAGSTIPRKRVTRALGSAQPSCRLVALLAVAGLAASVIADLPNWNWWAFSGTYTAVNVIDYTLTWLLAGLVIAKIAYPARLQGASAST